MPKLLRLYQVFLILRMAIQWAAELQMKPVLLVKSYFLSIASMETIVKCMVLSASE